MSNPEASTTKNQAAKEPSETSSAKMDPAVLAAIVTGIVTVLTTIITAVVAPIVSQATNQSSSPSDKTSPSETTKVHANSAAVSTIEQLFYVVAGESEFPDSLMQEPKRAAGLEFARSFPNIKICSSKVDPKKYYLVLGSNLTKSEADGLRQQAIVNNFRRDTYVQSAKEIFFVPANCSAVVK